MPKKRVSSLPSIWMCKGLGNRLKTQWGRRLCSQAVFVSCSLVEKGLANSSREPRELFSGVKILPASRESLFQGWYLLSRAAATFFQGEIASRELREDFAEKNWEKFGGLEKLYYVRGRKVRRWSASKGEANKHRGKLPQILFKRSRCPTSSFLNGEKPFMRGH